MAITEHADVPVLPYAGTSGWSGSSTSRERALDADTSGLTARRQRETLRWLAAHGSSGITVAELRRITGWHHGQASAVLSNLQKAGVITRLVERRDRCQVYVTNDHVDGRPVAEYRPNAGRPPLSEEEAVLVDHLERILTRYPGVARFEVGRDNLTILTTLVRRLAR